MNQNFIITRINGVIFVDKKEYPEKFTHFSHTISNNELIFHFSGKSTVKFNGKTLYCEKDCIRFLPKGDNREYTVDREEHGDCIDIFFETDSPVSDEAFTTKPQNSAAVGNLFKKIFSVWTSKNEGYYYRCVSLLYEVFSELQKQRYIPESQYNAIKPAIRYIEENALYKKITVTDLANLCKISESYLKKLFIKKFGVSPVQYIILRKINYACDLLRSGRYNVSQTSEICGYGNVYYFSRQFKAYMGISPSDFIAKHRS